jgi:hypothetical protein
MAIFLTLGSQKQPPLHYYTQLGTVVRTQDLVHSQWPPLVHWQAASLGLQMHSESVFPEPLLNITLATVCCGHSSKRCIVSHSDLEHLPQMETLVAQHDLCIANTLDRPPTAWQQSLLHPAASPPCFPCHPPASHPSWPNPKKRLQAYSRSSPFSEKNLLRMLRT